MIASGSICVHGQEVEYRFFDPADRFAGRPVIVMLHEGLGSISIWKEFPVVLAHTARCRVLAYSRAGYGRSSAPSEPPEALQMHENEALLVLPEVLRSLHIERPLLFGHSDGASIALIHAGRFPHDVAGVIALAPHLFVEEMCLTAIANVRDKYLTTDLERRLARYHQDPRRAFWQWNNVWLDPLFRNWNIEHYARSIICPVLAIQGYQDEYGTMEQLERLARAAPGVELLKLQDCRHSPHQDRPVEVLEAIRTFVARLISTRSGPAVSTCQESAL